MKNMTIMKNMTKKKKIIFIVIAVLLLIAGGSFFYIKNKQNKEQDTPDNVKQKISPKVNIIPVSERPYMQLSPNADGHHITISVLELKKPATSLNYEMEYQTGSMLQGFQGMLKLDQLPISDKKLFGSQSAGGAITYHEDIKGGSFLAEFMGPEDYAVKSNWRYFTNNKRESEFQSQDTKFTIANDSLSAYSYLIIFNNPGYPGEIEGELISDIYSLSAEKSLKTLSSEFTVTFSSKEEQAQILGYDGNDWQEIETLQSDGLATASSALMDAYVLIKK
ncbi:MAG: hypothetical protein GX559_01325 [Candidatus Pacebacteria bacterium]|nr:hypothetical protein [Candidatus Paceibacterota bacterium]